MDIEKIKQHVLRGVNSVNGALPEQRVMAIAERILAKQTAKPVEYAYIAGRNAAIDAKRAQDRRIRLAAEEAEKARVAELARQRRLTGIRQLHDAVARLHASPSSRVTPVIAAGLDALLKFAITGIPGDVLAREQGVTLWNLHQRVVRAKRLLRPLLGEEGLELLIFRS